MGSLLVIQATPSADDTITGKLPEAATPTNKPLPVVRFPMDCSRAGFQFWPSSETKVMAVALVPIPVGRLATHRPLA